MPGGSSYRDLELPGVNCNWNFQEVDHFWKNYCASYIAWISAAVSDEIQATPYAEKRNRKVSSMPVWATYLPETKLLECTSRHGSNQQLYLAEQSSRQCPFHGEGKNYLFTTQNSSKKLGYDSTKCCLLKSIFLRGRNQVNSLEITLITAFFTF